MAAPLPPTGEPAEYNDNYILFWNSVALDFNRLVPTLNGPNNSPPSGARALGILHLAIHDAYFAVRPDPAGVITTYLAPNNSDPLLRLPEVGSATDPRQAVAGAAYTVLLQLYTTHTFLISTNTTNILTNYLNSRVAEFPNLDALSSSYRFGTAVGRVILASLDIRPLEPEFDEGFEQGSYRPRPGQYRFNDDPTNPVRIQPFDVNLPLGPTQAVRVYNAPFYGLTARRFAVQGDVNGVQTEHIIADPPVGYGIDDLADYNSAFAEVVTSGGAAERNATRRTPAQTTNAYFWAYDGTNLIGTPARAYNQIIRKIAWERRPAGPTAEETNADFARLFALVNASLADAGIFAWQEKWRFEFWRPLTGIREDTENEMVDPFFQVLGAPPTNSNSIPFKPPFPAYPSGHATFGGAVFQAARLYYKARDNLDFAADEADSISFDVVSDELNGINRELRQPYTPALPITDQLGEVRTRVVRHFPSLWAAIFDNAISRIYLGVHWRFDAFASEDVLGSPTPDENGLTVYKSPETIKYDAVGPRVDRPGQLYPRGGVPLGIGIANDIVTNNLKPTPANLQPSGRERSGDLPDNPTSLPVPPPSTVRKDSGFGLSFALQKE